jgi:hypothetical protein
MNTIKIVSPTTFRHREIPDQVRDDGEEPSGLLYVTPTGGRGSMDNCNCARAILGALHRPEAEGAWTTAIRS